MWYLYEMFSWLLTIGMSVKLMWIVEQSSGAAFENSVFISDSIFSPMHAGGAVLLFSHCGLERNSSAFYMKIAFSLPPFNIKIFYNFFLFVARHYPEMKMWIIIVCNGELTLLCMMHQYSAKLSTDCTNSTKHSFSIQIIYFSKEEKYVGETVKCNFNFKCCSDPSKSS